MKLFIFIILGLFFNTANACDCDTLPFNDATEWADEIFIGRIIEIKAIDSITENGLTISTTFKIKIEISKKWKGDSKKYIEIYQAGSSCDFYLSIYETAYLIYAKKSKTKGFLEIPKGEHYTYRCSRSADFITFNNWNGKGRDDRDKLNKKFKLVELKE